MTQMNYQTKKETILSPYETTMNIEAWITDAKYIQTPNRFDEYVFTFQPLSYHDYGRISEAVMTALQQVEISSYETATDHTETKDGSFICSQLFAPKINKEINCPEMDFEYKQVSLKIHLREDVANRVFLQCDYIDFFEEDVIEPGVSDDWVPPEGYIDF